MNHQIKLFGEALPESPYGTSFFWFDSLSGIEKINELFEYHLIVKVRDEYHNPAHGYRGLEGFVSKQSANNGGTPGSDLNLQSLIGTELVVCMRLDGLKIEYTQLGLGNNSNGEYTEQSSLHGDRFYRGLVNRVEVLPVRNRHATYKITLVPWLWLLTKTTNYKIYQKKTVLEIIEEVLQRYPYPVEYRCSGSYDRLDFQAQYGESDFQYIQRLMVEHGINFHFEHSKNHLTLVISDHNAAFKEMDAEGYRNLSIYPPNQRFPNQAEYIEFFEPAQQLVSGKVQLSDYQFKKPSLTQTAQDQFLWDHHFAEQEIYEWQQGDFSTAEDGGELKAKQRVEQLYQHGYRAQGKGHLKGLQTGYRFNLENHPNEDSNQGWLVLGTQTTIQDLSEEKADNQFYDSKVEFLVQPDAQIFRPDRTVEKPQGRPQTATVVGPAGQEIHTDQYGRVKVQFHWDRLGAKDQNSTCWLRVSTAWAGNNFGTIHLPRIGQEVIVDFFNGDPDMPFVAGRLTNPENMPLWELPEQIALSGIKSKELGGNQANQLVMDDTNGQVQVHLKSDHQASELNLGYITRIPDPSGRKDFRGEGFELRTDGYGVLRAAKGVLLSAYARIKAKNHQTDFSETFKLLQESQQAHFTMGEAASQFDAMLKDADQVEVAKEVDSQNQQLNGQSKSGGKIEEFQQAHILVTTPNGIATHAKENIMLHAGQHIALTGQGHISQVSRKSVLMSAVESIKLFAYKTGMKMIAAGGDVDIQAVQNSINILAKLDIKQSANKITLSAQEEVTIIGGGSYTTWKNGVVETGSSGEWKVHAASHAMTGAQSKTSSLSQPATAKGNLNLERIFSKGLTGETLAGMSGLAFSVIDALGQKKQGQLDDSGKATVTGLAAGPAQINFEKDSKSGWVANDRINTFEWLENSFVAEPQQDSLFATAHNALEKVGQVAGQLANLTGNEKLAKASQGVALLNNGREVLQQASLKNLTGIANAVGNLTGDTKFSQLGQGLELVNQVGNQINASKNNAIMNLMDQSRTLN